MNENKDCSVVILAAGQGKRMNNPDLPKVLADLDGNPLLSYVLDASNAINPSSTIAIVGHQKEIVEEYLKNNYEEQNAYGARYVTAVDPSVTDGSNGDIWYKY